MDDQTPHRRRRTRTDSDASVSSAPSSFTSGVFDSDPFPRHVQQTESSRPRSVSTLATPQNPAQARQRSTSNHSERRAADNGTTHVYRVSDEPVRRAPSMSSRRTSSAQQSESNTYYYPPSEYASTARRPRQDNPQSARPAAAQQRPPQSKQPAASSRKTPPRLVQGYRPDPPPAPPTPPRRSGGSSDGMPPRRKKQSPVFAYLKLAVVCMIVIGLFAGLYVGGTYLVEVKNTLNQGEGVFYSNLYINNIALGGMTKEQALAVVGTQVQQQVDAFSITIASTTGQSWTIDKTTLSMGYDVEERVNELWRVGHEGNAAQRYEQVKALATTPVYRYTALSYDITSLSSILSQIKSDVDRAAVNAMRISDNTVFPPFAYTNEQVGYSLDISAAYTDICGMIDRLESGTVTLTPTPIMPTVTKAQLQSEIQQIGYYETKINTAKANEGRTMNVTMGCQKFNHMVVANGARVSFNDITGKRNEKNGWYPALEIAYGEYTTGYGGGICQVSSTLYNACISAGLEIVRRTQHGLEVGYIDKGLDATVTNEGPDFIFRNNTGAELYIAAGVEARGNAKYCVFIIYGRPDPNGYRYNLEGRIVETLPIPEPTMKNDKDEDGDGLGDKYGLIYLDETKVESEGREGYKVDTYLITRDKDGNLVSEEYRYTDTFKAIAPVWYVGVTSRD